MNEPQMKLPGFLAVLAIGILIGLIGYVDNQHKEISQLKTACMEAR